MLNEKPIDYRFKILYAVGMIMVVCGHVGGGGISIISDWFPYGGLHLALFVFCSGYFYRSKAEESVPKYILKKLQSLVVPLYIYTVVYAIIVQISRLKGFEMGGDISFNNIFIAPITNGHQFIYNMGGWFIAPLFMVEVYNIIIRKILKMINKNISEWAFFVISMVSGIAGNQLACMGYLQNWWLVLVRMLYFVPFYEMGILYKGKLEKIDRRIPSFWYFVIVFAVKLAIVYHYGKMLVYTPPWCNDFTEGPVMPIVIGYLGIALWVRIATILEPVIGRSKWINIIADNTYSIMMNQFLGFMIVKTVYAIISKLYIGFSDFDWISYKTDIWWYYIPKGLSYTLIIYVVAGIAFSIIVQKIIDKFAILWTLLDNVRK